MRLTLVLATLAAAATPALSFFRLPCGPPLVVERVDPIISPGAVAGHVHTVAGGSGFSMTSTYKDLRKSTCTSCLAKADLSAYWSPLLYVALADGTFKSVPGGTHLVYYLPRAHPTDRTKVLAFPEGLEMLAGSPMRRTYNASSLVDQAIGWNCLGATGVKETRIAQLPRQNCPDGLRGEIRFPSCWDGKNLKSATQSHVAYPIGGESGPCPATHPKRIITLFFEVMYDVNSMKDLWTLAKDPKSPFVLANGDPTGLGYHGDFQNGWDVPILQRAMDECTSDSGVIEECKVLELYDRAVEPACRKTPDVNEVVLGTLKKLPGCNPVTKTTAAARAASGTCPNLALPPVFKKTTTYTSKFAPPGSHVTKDMPSTVASYKSYKYQGCYSDVGARTLSKRLSPSAKTVAACVGAAKSAGYSYVGLEYGGECWAGNALASGAKEVAFGKCDMVCEGNKLNVCGGGNALSLYKLTRSTSSRVKRHEPHTLGHA
ncbi:uncharacterized protein RHOBADRAFT_55528 [Rhodotorula graminis WP1]|uniref:WSC domain-containing protein n=1 Tax=Rhodotorula graminis (strain WP1) TaxID=578459 RepID=A0A0P9GIM9_RHOGW|nr:uncharacterized protein RHOBADRAFT_55528 [Rhodotorula graminis WP1]KPV72855.1 hypothetical protein RHOBADRAFT_55528 [Rhodotorula graminis WP1]